MADVKDITPDLSRLDAMVDSLEDILNPLLDELDDTAAQLPLLDKAKLFSLMAYSVESLLYGVLRLQGVDAQNHSVYTELKRVQQYFNKIQAAEEPESQRSLVVNQEAAARILKADLSDNKSISSKLAEKIAEERAKALLKSVEDKKRPADDLATPSASGNEGRANKKRKQRGRGKGRAT